jgi:hypothetical protein
MNSRLPSKPRRHSHFGPAPMPTWLSPSGAGRDIGREAWQAPNQHVWRPPQPHAKQPGYGCGGGGGGGYAATGLRDPQQATQSFAIGDARHNSRFRDGAGGSPDQLQAACTFRSAPVPPLQKQHCHTAGGLRLADGGYPHHGGLPAPGARIDAPASRVPASYSNAKDNGRESFYGRRRESSSSQFGPRSSVDDGLVVNLDTPQGSDIDEAIQILSSDSDDGRVAATSERFGGLLARDAPASPAVKQLAALARKCEAPLRNESAEADAPAAVLRRWSLKGKRNIEEREPFDRPDVPQHLYAQAQGPLGSDSHIVAERCGAAPADSSGAAKCMVPPARPGFTAFPPPSRIPSALPEKSSAPLPGKRGIDNLLEKVLASRQQATLACASVEPSVYVAPSNVSAVRQHAFHLRNNADEPAAGAHDGLSASERAIETTAKHFNPKPLGGRRVESRPNWDPVDSLRQNQSCARPASAFGALAAPSYALEAAHCQGLRRSQQAFHSPQKKPRVLEGTGAIPTGQPQTAERPSVPRMFLCSYCAKFSVLLYERSCCSSFCAQSLHNSTSATAGVRPVNFPSEWESCSPREDLDLRLQVLVHDAQPHAFRGVTSFSSFSPYCAAAVAAGKKSLDRCAACGGEWGERRACERCPLAFHATCISHIGGDRGVGPTWHCPGCISGKRPDAKLDFAEPETAASIHDAFAPLIRKAKGANPIDYQLHPALYVSYCDEYGADWARCDECRKVRVVRGHDSNAPAPVYRCRDAVRLRDSFHCCEHVPAAESAVTSAIEAHRQLRSRRRSHLFMLLGEEHRELFGWPALNDRKAPPKNLLLDGDTRVGKAQSPITTSGSDATNLGLGQASASVVQGGKTASTLDLTLGAGSRAAAKSHETSPSASADHAQTNTRPLTMKECDKQMRLMTYALELDIQNDKQQAALLQLAAPNSPALADRVLLAMHVGYSVASARASGSDRTRLLQRQRSSWIRYAQRFLDFVNAGNDAYSWPGRTSSFEVSAPFGTACAEVGASDEERMAIYIACLDFEAHLVDKLFALAAQRDQTLLTTFRCATTPDHLRRGFELMAKRGVLED